MGKVLNLNNLLNEEKKNPFEDLKLSYSRLSDFDRNGPKALVERENIDNQGVKIGSLVDILLFEVEDLHSIYHISDHQEPTNTLGALCNIILQNYKSIPDENEIFNIIERNSFWKATKNKDTLRKNFNTSDFWGYLNDKFKSKDKEVISSSDYDKALCIVDAIKNHKFGNSFWNKEDVLRYYQVKFETKIEDVLFRGIIDIVEIDEVNKTIKLIDLKTTGSNVSEFMSSFVKYRYYLQASIYQKAFKDVLKALNLSDDYSLLPFEFFVIGTKEMIPVVYTVTDKWISAAEQGFTTSSGYKYRGLYELIDNIKYHIQENEYLLSKELSENNGLLNTDDSFINPINLNNDI